MANLVDIMHNLDGRYIVTIVETPMVHRVYKAVNITGRGHHFVTMIWKLKEVPKVISSLDMGSQFLVNHTSGLGGLTCRGLWCFFNVRHHLIIPYYFYQHL